MQLDVHVPTSLRPKANLGSCMEVDMLKHCRFCGNKNVPLLEAEINGEIAFFCKNTNCKGDWLKEEEECMELSIKCPVCSNYTPVGEIAKEKTFCSSSCERIYNRLKERNP